MQFIPSETLIIDRKARANMPFYDLDLRSPELRVCDFDDVVIEFDPEQAIPAAAALVADLAKQFGNLGLAAAAYNAGPGKVSRFLDAQQ